MCLWTVFETYLSLRKQNGENLHQSNDPSKELTSESDYFPQVSLLSHRRFFDGPHLDDYPVVSRRELK